MKILLAVLVPLTVLLGVHTVFEAVLAATLITSFATVRKARETGWHWAPRLTGRLA